MKGHPRFVPTFLPCSRGNWYASGACQSPSFLPPLNSSDSTYSCQRALQQPFCTTPSLLWSLLVEEKQNKQRSLLSFFFFFLISLPSHVNQIEKRVKNLILPMYHIGIFSFSSFLFCSFLGHLFFFFFLFDIENSEATVHMWDYWHRIVIFKFIFFLILYQINK